MGLPLDKFSVAISPLVKANSLLEIFHFHRSESLWFLSPSAALESGILLNGKEPFSTPDLYSISPTLAEDARMNYLTGPTTVTLSTKSVLTLHPGQSPITDPPSSVPGFPLVQRQLTVMLLKYRLSLGFEKTQAAASKMTNW